MRIKSKLQAIAILPLLVFLLAAAIELWVHKVNLALYASGSAIVEISRTTQNMVTLAYEYGITHGERAASQWQNQYAKAEQLLAAMTRDTGPPTDDPLIADIRQGMEKSAMLFAELLAQDNRQKQNNLPPTGTVARNNLVNRLILELQSILALSDKIHTKIVQATKHTMEQGAALTVGIVFLLALSLLALALVMTRGIHHSLFALEQGIRTVAQGDLGHRVNPQSRDELGELGRGFDAMTTKLAEVTVSRDQLLREMEEHRQAAVALNASEAKLKEAQRLAHLGSWELELTTDTLSWSEEIYRIFELDPQLFAANYEAFLALIHPEDRERVNQTYSDSLRSKTPYAIEHRLLMRDGRIKFVHERGETHYDRQGIPIRTTGTVQDITELRQAEAESRQLNSELEERVAARTRTLEEKSREVEEIQRALINIVEDLHLKSNELKEANLKLQDIDRLKSMFIASMSHELRTPLNSIIGFSSIVLDEWLGPLNAEQKEKLAIVLRTGKHLLALINDLIDISRIEAGKLESIPEEFDLFDLLAEAAGLVESELAARGIAFSLAAIHLTMVTDRRRLYQCVVNLLGNAAKFTRQGTISLAAFPEERAGVAMVTIAVRDSGIGIKEEDLPKLFTSFVRLPLPEDMAVKGTGLGLYLVRKITTEILGGTVNAASSHGQGSEFRLTVPVRRKLASDPEKQVP